MKSPSSVLIVIQIGEWSEKRDDKVSQEVILDCKTFDIKNRSSLLAKQGDLCLKV